MLHADGHIADSPGTTGWSQLPLSCLDYIAAFLPKSFVACTLRFVNKAAAEHFRRAEFMTVRISQPVPCHAFAWRWGSPGALRNLTLNQRRQLVCLTACSGAIPNLALALECTGCRLASDVFEAAAGSCSSTVADTLEWLQQRGCPKGRSLEAAARAGNMPACEWLLANGCAWGPGAVCVAARSGHSAVAEWLLQQRPRSGDAVDGGDAALMDAESMPIVAAAAAGCDLATLQRLHTQWLQQQGFGPGRPAPEHALPAQILAAAAASPTPDWAAKVEWLEAQGYRRRSEAFDAAAGCADGVERMAWLRRRGYAPWRAADQAVLAGNVAALRTLLPAGADASQIGLPYVAAAASQGWLGVLKLLAEHRRLADEIALTKAAVSGQLEVVAWLVEALGYARRLRPRHMHWAAQSGSVRLMAWLRERGCSWGEEAFAAAAGAVEATGGVAALAWLREQGCPWDARTFVRAAAVGSEEALEWLAEQGCPMGADGSAYVFAARNGDLHTLRCLRRLGCPWDPAGATLTACACSCSVDVLAWLLEAGCPVDWPKAERAAKSRRDGARAWLVEQRQRAAVAAEPPRE
ncbi:hypothetical protein GPECTOR_60g740 [Gonium pectorale]|uniref:Uncharacterized protein n=1 Tax=Gonium pectorale TaxID=33097 RepID=A0A150G524_GONPE|nr:hypothetical protein GPECTOR_60g740 [Gonium pectorale]|eukprot:KXZ44962.1 hypothetical protein GPECTOR_60g740 [Gonium pectorale]